MRLDNLPTGVFTAGPAPKVQKSPRLLRKMRALLFRRACCSRRGMFRLVFLPKLRPGWLLCASRALDSATPRVPKRPRYSLLPRCSAPGAPFMAATCGERPSAAYPAAPVRNNPVAGLPFRLPLCLPRGGIVPRLPGRAGHVRNIHRFLPKKPLISIDCGHLNMLSHCQVSFLTRREEGRIYPLCNMAE